MNDGVDNIGPGFNMTIRGYDRPDNDSVRFHGRTGHDDRAGHGGTGRDTAPVAENR